MNFARIEKKTIIFVYKLVQTHYIYQILQSFP